MWKILTLLFSLRYISVLSQTPEWYLSSAPAGKFWQGVAISGNGQYVIATNMATFTEPGVIYLSSDYGSTWTLSSAPTLTWYAACSSSSGQYLYAAAYDDGIYYSSDYGAEWLKSNAPAKGWRNLACEETGSYVFGTAGDEGIYYSSNYGADWGLLSAPTDLYWVGIACDSTCGQTVATVFGGGIYISTDGGYTYTQTSAPSLNWIAVASSSSGQYLVAVVQDDSSQCIYVSADYGSSWSATAAENQGGNGFHCVASDETAWAVFIRRRRHWRNIDVV